MVSLRLNTREFSSPLNRNSRTEDRRKRCSWARGFVTSWELRMTKRTRKPASADETTQRLECPSCHASVASEFAEVLEKDFTPVMYVEQPTGPKYTVVVVCKNGHQVTVEVPYGYMRVPWRGRR
jgi:hypothetical protein